MLHVKWYTIAPRATCGIIKLVFNIRGIKQICAIIVELASVLIEAFVSDSCGGIKFFYRYDINRLVCLIEQKSNIQQFAKFLQEGINRPVRQGFSNLKCRVRIDDKHPAKIRNEVL